MRPTPEQLLLVVAARQDGVVSHQQCRRAGMTDRQIERRIHQQRWRRLHRQVYAVDVAALQPRARYLAASFGGGPDCAVSHRSGASLWSVQPHHPGAVHVVGGHPRAPRAGLVVHRTRRFEAEMRTVRFGVPVTTLARTLVDLAEVATRLEVETAVREAERIHDFDRRLLAPIPGRRNGGRLVPPRHFTRGFLEPRLRDLVTRHDLLEPEFNARWEEFELDAVWWDVGLVVEMQDWETHGNKRAAARDALRSRRVQAAGMRLAPVTYDDLTDGADRLATELRHLGVPRRSSERATHSPARWSSSSTLAVDNLDHPAS